MNRLLLKKENFLDALWSFLFTLVLGILPTWAMVGALRYYKQPFALSVFTENGEFLLYSASMMATIMYISVKDYLPLIYRNSLKNKKYPFVIKGAVPFQSALSLLALLIILASTVFYILVIIARLPNVQGLPTDIVFLNRISFWLFIPASLISFFTTVLDNAASSNFSDVDFRKSEEATKDDIENQLDKLMEEK